MIVRATNLTYSYNNTPVLEKISLSIKEGDFVALVGPNGSGKTTLVKLLLRLHHAQEGTIQLFNTPIESFNDWERIGYVPQRLIINSAFPATVEELMRLRSKDYEKVLRYLQIEGLRARKFQELSGGQQQRVLIALALLSEPRLLIFDEPTVGVDVATQREFYALLRRLNTHHHVTIVLVTHDIGLITKYAKSVLCINRNICLHAGVSKTARVLREAYGEDLEVLHHHHK